MSSRGVRSWMSLSVLVGAAALAACSATRNSSVAVVPGKLVAPGSRVYLTAVVDGTERGGDVAAGSGFATAVGLRDALLRQGLPPLLGDGADINAGLDEASRLGYPYLVRGAITEWEDNATPVSTRPDRAGLSVELYDVATRELIATSTHQVEGARGDYASRTPDRFISELADTCLGTLFGWKPSVETRR